MHGRIGMVNKIVDLLQFTKFLANPGTRTTLPADHVGFSPANPVEFTTCLKETSSPLKVS
jgi:hypothetical protein